MEAAGTSDVNQLRVRSTLSYLAKCDVIVILAPIDRAKTGIWLHDNINKCSKYAKKFLVVLTKTDVR
jgi:hypothetical protein